MFEVPLLMIYDFLYYIFPIWHRVTPEGKSTIEIRVLSSCICLFLLTIYCIINIGFHLIMAKGYLENTRRANRRERERERERNIEE